MSKSIENETTALADLPFESIVSEIMDQSEEYHAEIMKRCVLGPLEKYLKESISKRSNSIYFWLENQYKNSAPAPSAESNVIKETVKALSELPWVAHAEFKADHPGPYLSVLIQDPATKKKLFPDEGYSDKYYAQEPKAIEEEPKPLAIEGPKVTRTTLAQKLRLRAPDIEDAVVIPEEPEKPIELSLSDKFKDQVEKAKQAGLSIRGLDLDFTPLETVIAKIDILLNTDWEEQVFGSKPSSFRRALFDVSTLSGTFQEHAKILSVANENDEELKTLPEERLDELRSNFEAVTNAVENALNRAIKSRLERAGIGITVQEARLQTQKLEDLGLTIINDAITVGMD